MWSLSDSEAIKNKNGHDFKTCRKTGMKGFWSRKHGLCRCLHLMFIAGIQMDADADYGRYESIVLLRVYEHAVQDLIIEDGYVRRFRLCKQ